MVFVKKSNGQFTSMPAAELKKKSSSTSASRSAKPVLPAASTSFPSSKALSAPPAQLLLSTHEEESQASLATSLGSKADFSSPLEEVLDTAPAITPSHTSFADTHVVHVLEALSFSIPSDYENRLRTVVQLAIKQVRTDDQTRDVCQRSLKEGGLGLSEKQSIELLTRCREELKTMHPEYGVNLPATVTPANPFKHGMKKQSNRSSSASSSSLRSQRTSIVPASKEDKVTSILEAAQTVRRPVMNDVTFKPMAIGPIEEIRTTTLADIRRLAPISSDAFARFGQKLVNLKNESIVLFFEAREAYHRGVVFEEYTSLLLTSLIERKNIETVCASQEWKKEEVEEVVRMEKHLGL